MINRLLIAVDDSPPALAAAGYALRLAEAWSAQVRIVTVVEKGATPDAVLRHLSGVAQHHGIGCTTQALLGGPPFEVILAAAREWGADLIVMGRSDRRHPAGPHVGSQTEHLLEFTSIPVLVVPEPGT